MVSKSDAQVSIRTGPEKGAVHRYQTECPPPDSPLWRVAPTFVPATEADWPLIVWLSAKSSLAGAALAKDGSMSRIAMATITANTARWLLVLDIA
jgi:hypothetical protein